MTKTIFKKVVWLGRATTFVVGLAVILALTVGLASTALAGTGVGARFDLGKTNTVNAVSKLVGSVAGPNLLIDNNSANASATALDLQVEAGRAPMKVNSQTKVANLNADEVDGVSFFSSISGIGIDPPSVGPHDCVERSVAVPQMQGADLATLYPSRNFTTQGTDVTVETRAAVDDGVLFYVVCNLGDVTADPPAGSWGLLLARPDSTG